MKVVACVIFITILLFLCIFISYSVQNYIEDRKETYISKHNEGPGEEIKNLFWFVQDYFDQVILNPDMYSFYLLHISSDVTDIHVSRYRGLDRVPDLKKFCDTHLTIIKPKLVIASGDLTDAKYLDLRGSKQFIDEWQTYHSSLKHCQNVVKTWLDLRGNHDAFDTPDLDHRDNLFRQYSAQGRKHGSSYVYHHTEKFGKYSFIGVDASPNPGPKRPFNFFGYIKSDGEKMIEGLLNESQSSNMTIAFGHYPSSLIATQTGHSVRYILRNVTAYLCGHLHTLAGLVPHMYARHRTGMLELELGDWKDERIYRIMAVDHDMLSFVDAVKDRWPVVMVTNPKEASLIAPLHEPLYLMNKSTHIRILVFTDGSVNSVQVYIDDIYQGVARQSEGPLYVLPWQPSKLPPGVHTIRVIVQDSVNGRGVTEQTFSLDGTSPLLPFRGRFILMLDIASLVQVPFFFTVIVYVSVLIMLRKCSSIRSQLFTLHGGFFNPLLKFYNSWLYRVWLISRVSPLFYSLVGAMLYIVVGPWLVGEIVEGHTGVVFVWGMYVHGSYLPVCLTYVYGLFQVITFNIPLTLCLGYYLQYSQYGHKRKSLCHRVRHIYFPFFALVCFQTYIALSEFPAAYGTRALVLGPVRTGSVVLAIILFFIARKTNVNSLVCSHNN